MVPRRMVLGLCAGISISLASPRGVSSEIALLYRRYESILAVINDGQDDDARNERLWRRAAGLADQIIACPASSIADMHLKLKLMEEIEEPRARLAATPSLIGPQILLALLRDAERLSCP